MKSMKKWFALLLAMAMVLGMSVVASAAPALPKDTDSKTVDITNVEEGATYTAYQIIDATYAPNDGGFTGYVWAKGTTNAGQKVTFTGEGDEAVVQGLTSAMITALAKNPAGLENVTFTPNETELTAGTWMILVTPPENNPTKVYNPMVVSVYYTVEGSGTSNELTAGSVDANKNWTLETTDAFAKSSEIKLTKDLEKPETDTKVKVGDEVPFTITSTMPSYDKTYYENPVFTISDTIVNGLKYIGEPVVKVGGTTLTKDVEYELTYDENASFTVAFTVDYIHGLAGKDTTARAVEITYAAEVTDAAVVKVGENEAKLEFSTEPGETDNKTDKEYVFSFAIHGIFDKVDEKDEALPDAVFSLYLADAAGTETIVWDPNDETANVKANKVGEYTTGEDGEIKFKGLDGDTDKVYYLKETAAPDKYSINDTVYRITFEFDKPENYAGEDITYKVHVTDNVTNETKDYTVTYGETGTVIDVATGALDDYGNEAAEEAVKIQNTRLSALPSTGGIGTTIFTVAGCLIMVVAAGLFFASRRKSAKVSK